MEVSEKHADVIFTRAEEAELGVNHGEAVAGRKPTAGKEIAVNQDGTIGQILASQFRDARAIFDIGPQPDRFELKTWGNPVKIETMSFLSGRSY